MKNTRFSISLHDVCQDYSSQSWIASTPDGATKLRTSLAALGFPFSEDKVDETKPLFDILVCNTHRGSRTTYSFRTMAEIVSILAGNLSSNALPEAREAELMAFLQAVEGEPNFSYSDQECELSIDRAYEPAVLESVAA